MKPYVFDLEMSLIPIVAAMETAGIAIDRHYLAQLGASMQAQVGELRA